MPCWKEFSPLFSFGYKSGVRSGKQNGILLRLFLNFLWKMHWICCQIWKFQKEYSFSYFYHQDHWPLCFVPIPRHRQLEQRLYCITNGQSLLSTILKYIALYTLSVFPLWNEAKAHGAMYLLRNHQRK